MANKATSKSDENYYARYKQGNLYAAHRRAKLEKLIKQQPNNLQLPTALKAVSNYRRKAPTTPQWSHTAIHIAKLYKRFVGAFDKNLFSQKPEEMEAARRVRNQNLFPQTSSKKQYFKRKASEFSLAARAHDGAGNLLWS